MAEKDADFLKKLLAIFAIEAREHIDALFSGIAELENSADGDAQTVLIEKIFREAHSLKGASRSVGMTGIETACQALENTLAAMKLKEIVPAPALFDNLNQSVRHLSELLLSQEPTQSFSGSPTTPVPVEAAPQAALTIEPVTIPNAGAAAVSRHALPDENQAATGTVRVTTAKLDSILLKTEEMLTTKLSAQQRKLELQEINDLVTAWKKDWVKAKEHFTKPGPADAGFSQGMNLVEDNAVFLNDLMSRLSKLKKAADQDQRLLGRWVDDLVVDMKEVLMLPFSTLTEIFPRMVREFARDIGKEINLDIKGGDIKADRRIIEDIKDPLMHLLRNCVDHGIEKPAQRVACNKPGCGTIAITFKPKDGNRVQIVIADDGAGIDIDKVKETAERLGMLSAEQLSNLDRRQTLELVYQSGISTSPIITEISGRGLGLAIVQEKVDRLGGSIDLETQPGTGSTFRIVLPLMFATYRGIVVRLGEQSFVFPAANAEQTLRVKTSEVLTIENRETIRFNDSTLSLVWLSDALALPRRDNPAQDRLQIVVLAAGRKRIAFVVDEVLFEQEVLVKTLGKQLARVRNITGATILGSGRVVPVINVSDLMKSALSVTHASRSVPDGSKKRQTLKKSVLVVEDSITARSLLKGILESAGYRVATAIDGIDGLTRLRSEEIDIVVSDVEMPRMNGFELTAKIRSDSKFSELPVVLVTALASREDREHGIDVGANAYIVKSSFEQSNLLEVVQRLI